MALIELSENEKEEIYQLKAKTKRKELTRRCQIILAANECSTEQEVAEKIKCDIRTIRRWLKKYHEFGIQGLYNKKGAGAKPKLTCHEVEKIITKKPSSFQIMATNWVSILICLAISIVYGKKVCPKTVRNYLHKMGYSFKRAKVKKPKKEIPEIVKELFSLSQIGKCIVLFLDETCVRLLPDIRGAWTKVGEQLQIMLSPKSWNASFYVFGAVELLSGKFLWQIFDKANQQTLKEFLQMISLTFKGYEIYVILDQAKYHTGKIIEEYIRGLGNLQFVFLPSGCPQLNPVERIWRYVKDRLANYGFKDIKDKNKFCVQLLKNLLPETIKSLTNGWKENYAKKCA